MTTGAAWVTLLMLTTTVVHMTVPCAFLDLSVASAHNMGPDQIITTVITKPQLVQNPRVHNFHGVYTNHPTF